ncbi:ABC transporter substrate-binding protein [Paenibacillus prosopidis]|uniref:Carbohydrate ABC transporter substrate-binding protein (CUT1 family) n=1 Tax=Paenibacillus prosopidis TaxID=630520 RepID=A0A368W6U8_9BACL|nr:extracellular solute-binding protein [Paenibacillus prosopidis]RCW49556.1 carbohydrate ABC transporter substrate-binding protein (CUT1 family) [Paenibacillus prosopidis]
MRIRAKVWKMGVLILLCAALTACSGGKSNEGTNGSSVPSGSMPETAEGTVVTMTVLTKDRFLAEAEQKFEEMFPGIDIQINEIVPADTSGGDKIVMKRGSDTGPKPEDVEKYVSSVNAALMSGNASDIISVENLPVDKYVGKGLLADWNEEAGKDSSFNKSDYYENIFDGVSKGNGWYGVPASFSLDVMFGDVSLLGQSSLVDKTWTWDQFVDLLGKTKTDGKYGIAMIKPELLLKYVAESVYGQLLKKDGKSVSFDGRAFQAYMEKIKSLYDGGLATSEMMGPENTSFSPLSIDSPMNALLMPQIEGKSKTMLRPPGTGQDEGMPFKSSLVLGLNANSKVKNAAWSFVKFLLSEEMQSSRAMMNFPVNKAALKKGLASTKQMIEGGGSQGGKSSSIKLRGKDGQEIKPTVNEEDINKVIAMMPTVGKYANQDLKVLGMITEESAAYFNGNKSADAVAKSLANRINTYLNE